MMRAAFESDKCPATGEAEPGFQLHELGTRSGFSPSQTVGPTAGMQQRTFRESVANGSNRPFAAVPDQPHERTESDAMRKFQVNPPSVPELEATGMVAPCSVKRHNRLLEGRGGVRR
jgi:hypothetical protein